MTATIFYSWQSDSNPKLNRYFIEDAIKRAIKLLGADAEVKEALRDNEIKLDKDTQGMPGTPAIVDAIFEKIEQAEIFIGDMTYVAESEKRKLSNPNVLIEYGWALNELSHSRMITLMNGKQTEVIEHLPFDMKHLRAPMTYMLTSDMSKNEQDQVKDKLVQDLSIAIKSILTLGTRKPVLPGPRHTPLRSKSKLSHFLNDGDEVYENESYVPDSYDSDDEDEDGSSTVGWYSEAEYFIRVIPVEQRPDIKLVALKQLAMASNIRPFGDIHGVAWRTNDSGVVCCDPPRGTNNYTSKMTQITQSGEIWGVNGDNHTKKIIQYLEPSFRNHLNKFRDFLRNDLKYEGPIDIVLGIRGFKGCPIALPPMPQGCPGWQEPVMGKCLRDEIHSKFNDVKVDADLEPLLISFFEKVWDTCGLDRDVLLGVIKQTEDTYVLKTDFKK